MLSGFENPFHLLIIGLVILMLFGAKRLPEMGHSLGSGMREFRDGVMGRGPSAPAQGALESPAAAVNESRPGEHIG